MGIYLGQLPPAEIARLKAELAETLIANFCYPRFYDYRTESLRMRPIDRTKRQEVWLYLSSVDFTSWSRLDLTSPDFQRQVERLFIQFVQRNRSFFGEQGRKRMADIRMLIGTSSSSVVQGLRSHITGQRQGNTPFGSPRPVVSWSIGNVNGRPDPGWEQIATATMLLQQQLQEIRGEVKATPVNDGRPTNGAARRTMRGSTTNLEYDAPVASIPQASSPGNRPVPQVSTSPTATGPLPGSTGNGSARQVSSRPAMPPQPAAVVPPAPVRKVEAGQAATPAAAEPIKPTNSAISSLPTEQTLAFVPSTPPAPVQARSLPQPAQATPTVTGIAPAQRENPMMVVGEDDVAIFEQMRHQLVLWLRVEAVRLGLEISGQGPSQLLELLRQQERFDETRLQVVSTLLNLANQIIKNGQVSVIDYKQALMFHLMHTRQ